MNQRTITQYLKINIKEILQVAELVDNEVYVYGETFGIEFIESNLGRGYIPFFVCPGCQQRRRDLYQVCNEWKCYKCHDLVYYSQQRSKNDWWYWFNRAIEQARKIEEDFYFKSFNELLNYSIVFPMFKPKYMKQTKYDDIRFWYNMYMFRGFGLMVEDMSRGLARIRK